MKILLLSLVLVAASLGARAQEYYLDLSRQRLAVPGRTVAVEQVLDGRPGDQPIGYAYRGLSNNRPLAVAFRQGLSPELSAFIQRQLPARPTDHPLVLCLRQLQLNEEHTLGTEGATAYLSLDAYLHLPDGYHFVQSIASHTTARAAEVTRLHAVHLARLLNYCLGQLSQADWAAAPAQPALTLAQLPADVPVARPSRPAAAQPAILRERPRRGVYRSFAQFLANQPDGRRALRLDTVQPRLRSYLAWQQWQRVPWVRPLVVDSLGRWSEPAGIWGFSDGQGVFVRHDQHFFPLLRQGAFFTTVGNAPLDSKLSQLEAAARAQAAYTSTQPVLPPSVTDVPVGYAVDMRSGELHPYPGLRAPTRPDTAYVYVYRPAQALGPAQVQVWLNGKHAGTLRPGEYLELPWPYYATLFSLCLTDGASGSACQHLLPDVSQPNFLRVSFSPEAPLWQWVPPAQGLADLDELDRLRR